MEGLLPMGLLQSEHPGKISLLRKLQAQTLPDATKKINKIHLFSNIFITFELILTGKKT